MRMYWYAYELTVSEIQISLEYNTPANLRTGKFCNIFLHSGPIQDPIEYRAPFRLDKAAGM